MDYDDFVESLQTMMEINLNQTDTNFQNVLPRIIEYGENRLYRELTFLAITVSDGSEVITPSVRRITVPAKFLDVRYCNLCLPSTGNPDQGVRTPLERVSPETLDFIWPDSSAGPGPPTKYAIYGLEAAYATGGAFTMRIAPAADAANTVEIIGPVKPPPLSKTNPETILTVRYPEMFLCVCMIFGKGYHGDYEGASGWNAQYKELREATMVEVNRQKSESVGWSTQTPSMLGDRPRPQTG
jgi:hypothetical protein